MKTTPTKRAQWVMLTVASFMSLATASGSMNEIPARDSAQCTAGTQIIDTRQCNITCGVDHAGGDYGRQYTGTFQACVNACAADVNCVTAQFHEGIGYCYFKNAINPPSNIAQVDTVICGPPMNHGPSCNFDNFADKGGCSSNCFCDQVAGAASGSAGFCDMDNNFYCNRLNCNTNADCPSGYGCASDSYPQICGSNKCVPVTGCTSTYSNKRSLERRIPFIPVLEMPRSLVERDGGAVPKPLQYCYNGTIQATGESC